MTRVNESFTEAQRNEFLTLIRSFFEDLEKADNATATLRGKDLGDIHLEGRFNYHLMLFGATAPKTLRAQIEAATDPTYKDCKIEIKYLSAELPLNFMIRCALTSVHEEYEGWVIVTMLPTI
jgi:hypothetical protein